MPPSPVTSPASTEFARSARAALQHPPAGIDEWFFRYNGDLLDERGLASYLRSKAQLFDFVGGVQGRVVVDAGSGFGMVPNLAASWGAKSVVALELHRPMVESHQRTLRSAFPQLAGRVHPVRSDASVLPVRTASADVVVSIEAISHYYDVDAFLDESARVLRPGGWLVISDGNNGANPATRAHTEDLWERMERGPEGPCGDHVVIEPMEWRRVKLIRERWPQLPEEKVQHFARNTSGLIVPEIAAAIDGHLAGGPAPATPYRRGVSPREPVWGYWHEQLFDPPKLAADIARRGFRARAIPHYGGAANDLVLVANALLRAIPSFRWARAFRIAAQRL